MELAQLENLVTVAEQLHFRRAAAIAGVSPSTLSRQIGDLESDIGVRLFDRNRRAVNLTPAGEAFVAEARAVLQRLRSATLDAQRVQQGQGGRLRIGYCDGAGTLLLRRALPALRTLEPTLRLELVEDHTPQVVEGLAARSLDVGILRHTVSIEGVATTPLCDEELVAVLPPGHRLARRKRLTLADLEGEPVVSLKRAGPAGVGGAEVLIGLADGATATVEEGASPGSVLLLVAAGSGVAVLARSTASSQDADGVEIRRFSGAPPTVPLFAAWREGDTNRAVGALVDALGAAVVERAGDPDSGISLRAEGPAPAPSDAPRARTVAGRPARAARNPARPEAGDRSGRRRG